LLTEHDDYELQAMDSIDIKTSSWFIYTRENIRKKGGALFGEALWSSDYLS